MRIRESTLFKKWLFSYCVLLSIGLIISGFTYRKAVTAVRVENEQSMRASTKRITSNMELILQNSKELAQQLSTNEYLQAMAFDVKLSEAQMIYNNYKLVNILKTYQQIYEFIDEIYVYDQKNVQVVTNLSVYTPAMYHSLYGYNQIEDYNNWINNLTEYHYLETVPVREPNSDSSFLLINSVYKNVIQYGEASIVVKLDGHLLRKIFEELQSPGQVTLFFHKDELILSTDFFERGTINDLGQLRVMDNIQYVDINGRDYASYVSFSNKTGWKCVSLIDRDAFLRQVFNLLLWSLGSIFLTFLIGIAFSFFATRQNYTPIHNLVSIFNSMGKQHANKNELNYIEQNIRYIIQERDELDKSVFKQMKLLRDSFLERLISAQIPVTENLSVLCNRYDVIFPYDHFLILLVVIHSYKPASYVADSGRDKPGADIEQIEKLAFRNIGEEILRSIGKAYLVEMSDLIGGILNFSGTRDEIVFIELRDCITEMTKIMSENFHVEIAAAASSIGDYSRINQLFPEALEVLEFTGTSERSFTFYTEFNGIHKGQNYRDADNQAKSRQLIDEDKVKKLKEILRFIRDNYSDPDLSVSYIADKYDYALSKLSRHYKEYYGVGLHDHINKIRTQKARTLIEDKGYSISQAGEQVGFANIHTFIRVFKKYEGTTPGKLRKKE